MATANKYNVGPLLVVTPQSNIWCCSVRLPAKACRKHVNQKKTPAKQKNNKNYKGEEDSEDQRRIKNKKDKNWLPVTVLVEVFFVCVNKFPLPGLDFVDRVRSVVRLFGRSIVTVLQLSPSRLSMWNTSGNSCYFLIKSPRPILEFAYNFSGFLWISKIMT